MNDNLEWTRGQIRGFQCIAEGWDLVKPQYWLLLGAIWVGCLIAGIVPMWLLLGPMVVGWVLMLLSRSRGDNATFEQLFKGFDLFGQSLIVVLVNLILPTIFITMLSYVAIIVIIVGASLIGSETQMNEAATALLVGLMIIVGSVAFSLLMVLSSVIYTISFVAICLLVDRSCTAMEAVGTAWKSCLGNGFGLLRFSIAIFLLNLLSACLCFLAFFVLPISLGAHFAFYRRLFPEQAPVEA